MVERAMILHVPSDIFGGVYMYWNGHQSELTSEEEIGILPPRQPRRWRVRRTRRVYQVVQHPTHNNGVCIVP